MVNEEIDKNLATEKELYRNTYSATARDYFEMKKDGLKSSTAKRIFWSIAALVLLSTIIPQIASERNRTELAEEIRMGAESDTKSNMQIPLISSEITARRRLDTNSQKLMPVTKIKSIDLRAMTEPPPGAEVNAILVSGGANGTVKVRTTQDLVLNNELYAEAGSLLIGTGSSTEKRLYVAFSLLVSREGKAKKIIAQAYDFKDRIRGLNGKKVSDQIFKLAASSALIFLSGLSDSMQDNNGYNPFGTQKKSLRDSALGGVAQASSENGKRMLDEMNNENQIEVQKETQLVVIFEHREDDDGK